MVTQEAVLKLIRRERAMWAIFIGIAFAMPSSTVRGWLSRLQKKGLIDSTETAWGKLYFLTRKGAQVAGSLNRKYTEPGYYTAGVVRTMFGEQSYAYERLAEVDGRGVLGVPVRERVTRPELQNLWPDVAAAVPNNASMRMARDKNRLERISVVGGNVKTAATKAWGRFVSLWYHSPAEEGQKKEYPMRELLRDEGSLAEVVIVPTLEYSHSLRQLLGKQKQTREQTLEFAKEKRKELVRKRNGKPDDGVRVASELVKRAKLALGDAKAKLNELTTMGRAGEELRAANEQLKVATGAVKSAEARRAEAVRNRNDQPDEELLKANQRLNRAQRELSIYKTFLGQLDIVVCERLAEVA